MPKINKYQDISEVERDKQQCFRCTKKINQTTVEIHMLKPLQSGGKYHLENLIPVCKDCYKILSGDSKKLNYLTIKDDLYYIAQTH
jgi:5-methylcytosine-specific restriction endonuclease McrA